MKMRKIIYLFATLLMLTACGGTRVSEKLDQIDSLIAREQIDSAGVILNGLKGVGMAPEEKAHYGLLATQLSYITNHPLPSDSLLDLSLIFYSNEGNRRKLADAYYYKSARSRINKDYPQAILYCKKAECLADQSKDIRLQFKIAENLAYLNGLCENDLLQLQYAQKSLALAQKVQNKNWIAYSINKISFAFYNLGQQDSAYYYIEKSKPYIDYVYDFDKTAFLMNIGLLYKETDKAKAKAYFEKALTYGELPDVLEHLADIYFAEGKKEEAYQLWKKALTTEGRYEKETRVRVSCAGRGRFSNKFPFAGASLFPVFFISEELKDDLSKNMLISGFGVAMKLAVFIFPVVWQLATPRFREVIDSNGNKLLVDSTGTVYSYGGNRIGEMIDHNKYVKY